VDDLSAPVLVVLQRRRGASRSARLAETHHVTEERMLRERRIYEPPDLCELGRADELTLGNFGCGNDGYSCERWYPDDEGEGAV
jgi:hypothetical protein